jgi:hypothetical protein
MSIYSDGTFVLPGGTEPIRIWFEWLKLALTDPTAEVRRDLYAAWGDISDQRFDDWFPIHWRDLFGVSTITELSGGSIVPSSNESITIAFPKNGNREKIRIQIEELLANRLESSGVFNDRAPFSIPHNYVRGILPKVKETRRYLRLYELYVGLCSCTETDIMERLAVSYFETYQDWVARETANERKVEKLPKQFKGYYEVLCERKSSPAFDIHRHTFDWVGENDSFSGEDCRKFFMDNWARVKERTAAVCDGKYPHPS